MLANQPEVADEYGRLSRRQFLPTAGAFTRAMHARSRLRLKFDEQPAALSPRRAASATSSRARGCSLGCSAAAASRSTSLTRSSLSCGSGFSGVKDEAIAQLGLPFGQVPVLSKATVSTRASPSIAAPPLTSTPRWASRAVAASTAAGRRQHQRARAGDHEHRQCRHQVESRATPSAKSHRQSAGPLVARNTTAATPSTAGRNRRA